MLQWANITVIAVAYCYFEALVRTAEPYKFEEEVARLKSFRNIMTDGGFDEALYVDFAEEAWDLLHKLANVPVDTGLAIVLETFNDEHLSQAIFTYFKVEESKYVC
jgi:ubiquitin thioesterase protein OTUB1